MPTSFARHEPAAVQAARRAGRPGRRSADRRHEAAAGDLDTAGAAYGTRNSPPRGRAASGSCAGAPRGRPPMRRGSRHPRQTSATSLLVVALQTSGLARPPSPTESSSDDPANQQAATLTPQDTLIHWP